MMRPHGGATAAYVRALDCAQLAKSVLHAVNPTSQANLLSRWRSEIENARVRYGFTTLHGEVFRAATAADNGLVPVHRLYKPARNDFVWIASAAEVASAVANHGYVDQGMNFYASASQASCAQPVYRLQKGSMHRHAATEAERDALVAAGWRYETVSFYAARDAVQPVATKFSIAMIPDTQNEVKVMFPGNTSRRLNDWRTRVRKEWLVKNREPLKLAFVGHTGDLVNWGENEVPEAPQFAEHQYKVVSTGMDVLWSAGIPFSVAQGNQDTKSVCAGGSGCAGQNAHTNVRLSPLFNQISASVSAAWQVACRRANYRTTTACSTPAA